MKKSTCRSGFFGNEDDAVMYVIEHELMADSRERAVTLEQIIDMGIRRHHCRERPRDGKSGHPWSPRISVMMGVGTPAQTGHRENPHLFREKRTLNGKQTYYYWVDRFNDHRTPRMPERKSRIMTFFEKFKKCGNIFRK